MLHVYKHFFVGLFYNYIWKALSKARRMTPLSVSATHYFCPQRTAALRTLRKPAAAAAMDRHVCCGTSLIQTLVVGDNNELHIEFGLVSFRLGFNSL